MCIDKFENGYDLLKSSNDYEVIFMDYQMDGINGIETSRKIRETNKECVIIFVSAFLEASVESHEIPSFRFLLKPVEKEKLFSALDDYMKSIDYDNLLILNTREGAWKIKMSDIIYAEAKSKHTIIRTTKRTLETFTHLKKIEEKLPPEKFVRCQRAYIAGLAHVEKYSNTEIVFDNDEKAQIGPAYFKKFKEALHHYIMIYNERLL